MLFLPHPTTEDGSGEERRPTNDEDLESLESLDSLDEDEAGQDLLQAVAIALPQ